MNLTACIAITGGFFARNLLRKTPFREYAVDVLQRIVSELF